MWIVAFFSVLLVVIIIYALLAKKNAGHDQFLHKSDPAEKESDSDSHSTFQ